MDLHVHSVALDQQTHEGLLLTNDLDEYQSNFIVSRSNQKNRHTESSFSCRRICMWREISNYTCLSEALSGVIHGCLNGKNIIV